ncbi:PIG-L family deacetylase [Deminuibacter soli]|uniref:PIG-L family deacetylase n=2 Tax=Deminuibacter soli TaxID=2291815 RepID=A0A3E1NCL5_9BACT|nr:PIG-L family deacetylase [Deminuibacter soli]
MALLAVSCLQATAQAPETDNSATIYRKLEKLNVLGNVLYIAAHPDDENNRLLAYLARGKQYKTGYLSLTRGDGGQNLIGTEQGVELGLVRTQELLAARRIDGADQYFSRAYDFGFSKNADEALAIWNHDKILSDVVWVIRRVRPDIIITRFPGDARAGHGHHWASTLLANEAFKAAADSTRFPEQFTYGGVKPWQAKRIMWNAYNFGGNVDTSGGGKPFKLDIGGYNALLGENYGEIAADSRSQHKTQAFGVARQRGQAFEYFITTGGEAPRNDLMDGVETGWERIKNAGAVQAAINRIINAYNFVHPEYSVDSLVSLQQLLAKMPFNEIISRKLQEVNELILQCSGLFAEATTGNEYAVQGGQFKVNFSVNKRNAANITLKAVRLGAFDTSLQYSLPLNQSFNLTNVFPVDINRPASQPYWLANAMETGSYTVNNQVYIGKNENDPEFTAQFVFTINGVDLLVNRPVQFKYVDPAKGEMYEPFPVITPVIVSVSPNVVLTNVQPGNEFTRNPMIKVQYKANFSGKGIPVQVRVAQAGFSVSMGDSVLSSVAANKKAVKDTVVDMEPGREIMLNVPVKDMYVQQKGLENKLRVEVMINRDGHKYVYTNYLRVIKYDHIPNIAYNYRDMVKVVPDEVKTKGRTIGYINGAGDRVPQALVQMGYEVKLLNEADITADNLKQFDAVITGVRAHNVHEYLDAKYDVLMDYVHNGGNLIVQYNTNTGGSPLKVRMAPYPFLITTTRVTDENADVKFLLPDHPALNFPNKITTADFKDWIQERSTYQGEQADSHYAMPLAMADKGEAVSNGSLLISPYGKGNFVYTGLVFFRQLPAGVSGAYRLMANLIALPSHKNN